MSSMIPFPKFLIVFSIATFSNWALANEHGTCFPSQVSVVKSENLAQSKNLKIQKYSLKFSKSCRRRSTRSIEVLVTTIHQGQVKADILQQKRSSLKRGEKWNIRLNTSYFDRSGRPVYYIKRKSQNLGPKKTNYGGVFYCRRGTCHIVPASRYRESNKDDLALQSVPRLINNARYTRGLKNPNRTDARIGVAIDEKGRLLIFQSKSASFNELRVFLRSQLKVRNALALDGGSSTSFHSSVSLDGSGQITKIDLSHSRWVRVPYYIDLSN